MLLESPLSICGPPEWLVDAQHSCSDQEHQRQDGMNDRRRVSHSRQIDGWIRRDYGHLPERAHVDQQDHGREDRYAQLQDHPAVPKQPPRRAQRQDDAAEQRCMRQGNEDEPRRRRHQEGRAADLHGIVTGKPDDGQCEERQSRADPTEGRCDVVVNVNRRKAGVIMSKVPSWLVTPRQDSSGQ